MELCKLCCTSQMKNSSFGWRHYGQIWRRLPAKLPQSLLFCIGFPLETLQSAYIQLQLILTNKVLWSVK